MFSAFRSLARDELANSDAYEHRAIARPLGDLWSDHQAPDRLEVAIAQVLPP
jgi:hypothetical protein